MTIKEYKEKIEELEFVIEQKDKTIENLKSDIKCKEDRIKFIENNYISTSKIANMIRRLEYQQENEYCDFAIMILNLIVGG